MIWKRIGSAIIAALCLVGSYHFFGTAGLLAAGLFVAGGCVLEYARLAFRDGESSVFIRWTFIVICAGLLLTTVFLESPIAGLAQASIYFVTIVLLLISRKGDLQPALQLQSAGLMGFIYVGVFPALAIRVLRLPEGPKWFLGLMLIVFTGDTLAYLIGRWAGRRKLLEVVSPKKTVEGAMSGLIGSALAGFALGWFYGGPIPIYLIVLTAIISGAFAQVGDLYESLIKRVAAVKDSGSIMPGHGGLLDRVDGVLFAAPVYFSMVRLLLSFFT